MIQFIGRHLQSKTDTSSFARIYNHTATATKAATESEL